MGCRSFARVTPHTVVGGRRLLTSLLAAFVTILAVDLAGTPATPRETAVAADRSAIHLGGLMSQQPLLFEPNAGQAPAAVRYVAREGTARWLFTRYAATLLLARGAPVMP